MLFAIGMVVAAVIAYLPRDYPPFPETRVHPDDMIVMDLAAQDGRYIAVGELGHILITENPDGTWHEAEVHAEHVATLTAVRFVAPGVALAVGHSGWILRSEDGGQTWYEVHFDAKSTEPLLSIDGPYHGKLFAVGAYNQYLVSTDLGRTWDQRTLDMKKLDDNDNNKPGGDDQNSGSSGSTADRFPRFGGTGGFRSFTQLHYYDVAQSTNGTLFMAGEGGLLARSRDGGQTWVRLDQIYNGSFYGLLPLPDNRMLVYGMRGHVYVTDDGGKTWQRSEIPTEYSLFGAGRTEDGRIVLVGAAHTVLVSNDGGASFSLVEMDTRSDIAAILHIDGNTWLTGGIYGIDVMTLPEKGSDHSGVRS